MIKRDSRSLEYSSYYLGYLGFKVPGFGFRTSVRNVMHTLRTSHPVGPNLR